MLASWYTEVEHWLIWNQHGYDDLEVIQNVFGRWLWEVGKVQNELVRCESGWSSFAEREVKFIVDWLLMIVYEESQWYMILEEHA